MSTVDANSMGEELEYEMDFNGNEELNAAFVEGSCFRHGDLVFVIFLLHEVSGYTLCWGKGKNKEVPTGDKFDRAQTYSTLEEARAALKDSQAITLSFFNAL